MKHKRIAVLFVLVTFAGSPPVWHKLGSFISAVQHKAQIKFLSMVLERGSDEGEVADTPTTSPSELVASSNASDITRASARETKRPLSNSRNLRSKRPSMSDDLENVGLKHAAKLETSPRLYTFLAESPNSSNVPAVAAISREWVISEENLRQLQGHTQHDPTAPALDDKTNAEIRLKLRKYFEEHKGFRQRTRSLIGKPAIAPSSSTSTGVSTDGEG